MIQLGWTMITAGLTLGSWSFPELWHAAKNPGQFTV